jgi:hypothetical protein
LNAPPPEQVCTGLFDLFGNGHGLIPALNGTGAGNDGHVTVANGRRPHLDQRVIRFGLTTDQLVRFGNGHRFLHAGQADKQGRIHWPFIVQHPDRDTITAGDRSGRASAIFYDLDHFFDLFRCCCNVHYH